VHGECFPLPKDNSVFQRNADDVAAIPLATPEPRRVRVTKGRQVVRDWHETAGAVQRVPTGGPYRLEVRGRSGRTERANGLLVGDLWVLAGQSNMDGCGKLEHLERPSSKVHCYYYTETWDIARDPLCWPFESVDPVHWPLEEKELAALRASDRKFRETGAGLGVRFGKEIVRATGVPIGLITCSHGGTSVEQWDPALKDQGGNSLYGSMLRRIRACGGGVKGVLWYQGESNANPETAPRYKERMKNLIAAIRADLNTPALPFVQVQIARYFVDETAFSPGPWNQMQQVQLELEDEVDNLATVAAIDAALSDIVHLDALSLRRLGARMAELALVLAYNKKAPKALRPGRVVFADTAQTQIDVQYENVRGNLGPAGNVRGFYIEDAAGDRVAVRAAKIQGRAVRIVLERAVGRGARVWYGRGLNPTTTLHDELFAAPVFGPAIL